MTTLLPQNNNKRRKKTKKKAYEKGQALEYQRAKYLLLKYF